MSADSEKRTEVLVMFVATLAAGVIAGGLGWWMIGGGYNTPGFKEMIDGPTGLGNALHSDVQPPDRWPQLFGPNLDNTASDKGISLAWPAAGPPLVWKKPIGTGYSAPVADRGRVILFHRKGDRELVASLDAATGDGQWESGYPTSYVDRYGYNGGPRCTPIIDAERVYTFGAEGVLAAWDFSTGKQLWMRNLNVDYKVEQGFFGVGATPLLEGDRLIINVGGKTTSAGIVAVDVATGKTLWTATSDGASYATPMPATIHGQRHVFVFTEAGLVDLDPQSGHVFWSIPFRSKLYESANATSPLIVGDIVLVSATYNTGSLCVRIKPDGGWEELWRDPKSMESHFSNLVHVDGFVYGYSGRHEGSCKFACVELKSGRQRWAIGTELGRGSSVRIGGRLLLWGERGNLGVLTLDSTKAKLDSLTPGSLLNGHTWTPPALYERRLFLRNESELCCFDVAAP